MSAGGLVTLNITPVIYTEGAGPESRDELLAPYSPQSQVYELPLAPGGAPIGRVVGVWHAPVHNVAAIVAFDQLDVAPSERTPGNVLISVSAKPGQQGRLRLRITALCEVSGARRGGY